MKQNKYDNPEFFSAYGRMRRSTDGLAAAAEWPAFKAILPALAGKRVLDLGCGYGWHCRYAADQGAAQVVGVDLSARMIREARAQTESDSIKYVQASIEDFEAPAESFDVIISSLALHYVPDLQATFANSARLLVPGGTLCYSAEHPIFTARAAQDWHRDSGGHKAHWPVDGYFDEGERVTDFLGTEVVKYHRTMGSHFQALQSAGFTVESLVEPAPSPELMESMGWQDELRRPMMLIVRGRKQAAD